MAKLSSAQPIQEKVLGPDHPDVVTPPNNLPLSVGQKETGPKQ
jgi:hypothetical protein